MTDNVVSLDIAKARLSLETQIALFKATQNPMKHCIDLLSLALAHHNHEWTDEERRAYKAAMDL